MTLSNTSIAAVNGTGLFDDNPDVDPPSCQLLGPTALVVQALMGVLVILSLVYKRHREKPMRPWRIWMFDVSKQVLGQLFVHGLNVLISGVISDVTAGNACVSYFLNILIDTTFGIAIIYGVLHLVTFICSEKLGLKGCESGVYGNPPSLKYWCRQAAIYVVALTTMKFVVIALLVLFPGIFTIGEWLLSWTWTGEGDALQVIFVMGIFPIAMNVLQFWLIDSIVKASAGPLALESDRDPEAPTEPDLEPLFNSPSDDEDDGHHPSTRRADVENQLGTRASHTSIDSHSKSYATGLTTPDDDEHKSIDTVAKGQAHDHHAYPPSLSNSFTSASSSSNTPPRKKHLAHSASRSQSPAFHPFRRPKTPPQTTTHIPPTIATSKGTGEADEWAVSWDDEGDASWGDAPSVPLKHDPGHVVSQSTTVTSRPRRLS